jgi:2,3-bisphosphoglycerate-dependent phosphoglycerate mutase
MQQRLILIRHGQSLWNKEERFTGWTDIDLTECGVEQARAAARMLRGEGLSPTVVYTSMLRRAIRTAWTVLDEMDRMWVPVHTTWRLNERHYGELEGQNWNEVIRRRGDDWWAEWRRDYSLRPEPIHSADDRHPSRDERYARVPPAELRAGESVHDIMARILPVYVESILPALSRGESVLVAVHGIAIRAIDETIRAATGERLREIPNAVPIVYNVRRGLPVAESRRLLQEEIGAAGTAGPDGSE